jgi:hypothetical protein
MDQNTERQTQTLSGDEIGRAMSRNGVRRGSSLEADIRARAYDIWYGSGLGVGPTDAKSRDRKMDAYIAERKGTPAFAGSFIPEASKTRIPISDQHAILSTDIRKILSGEVQIYDDRESPPR